MTAKVGPLHWHDPAAGLLRLTLREVRALLEHHGAPLRPPPPRCGATLFDHPSAITRRV